MNAESPPKNQPLIDKEYEEIVDAIYEWNNKRFTKEHSYATTILCLEEELREFEYAETIEDQLDAIGDISFFLVGACWKLDIDPFIARTLLKQVTWNKQKHYLFNPYNPSSRKAGFRPYEDIFIALTMLVNNINLPSDGYRDVLRAIIKSNDTKHIPDPMVKFSGTVKAGDAIKKQDYVEPTEDLKVVAYKHRLLRTNFHYEYSSPQARSEMGGAPLVALGAYASTCDFSMRCLKEAGKSPCNKKKVGCVLVSKNGEVVATGYNYNPDCEPCEDEHGQTRGTVIHAENAACVEVGEDIEILQGGVVYINYYPCENCLRELMYYGIQYIVMVDGDPIEEGVEWEYDSNGIPRTRIFRSGYMEVLETKEFKKFDSGKPRYNLIPPEPLERLAVILGHGADKYGEDNWKLCTDLGRYIASLYRHVEAIRKGELIDPDSGEPHSAHIMANSIFMDYLLSVKYAELSEYKVYDNYNKDVLREEQNG